MTEQTKIYITYAVIFVLWYVLQTIGCMGVFKKAGVTKSKAFIPFVREMELFRISWADPKQGKIWLVCALVGLIGFIGGSFTQIQILAWVGVVGMILSTILSIRRNLKESKAFGRSTGTSALLIFLNPIGNIVIGRSSSEYRSAI